MDMDRLQVNNNKNKISLEVFLRTSGVKFKTKLKIVLSQDKRPKLIVDLRRRWSRKNQFNKIVKRI